MSIKLATDKIYSILELNTTVKGVLNREFPDFIWVHGEIQGYNRSKLKRHIFFELSEKHPEIDEVIARTRCVIFERVKTKINQRVKISDINFKLQDDIEVKFLCRVDLYPPSGNYMLIVEDIDPVYTLGRLAQNRQRLITQLKREGILDKNKTAFLSPVLLNIGLITSYDSAAYHDFITELEKSEIGFKVYLYNSVMQGKNTEQNICLGLELLNQRSILDAIVITRGGGSIADLAWFDNKKIAEAIAYSRLPVICGIGHEINITITDMASFAYMKTPTAIAKFLIERVNQFILELNTGLQNIITFAQDDIKDEKSKLQFLTNKVQTQTNKFMKVHIHILIENMIQLQLNVNNFIKNEKKSLKDRYLNMKKSARITLDSNSKNLHNILKSIKIADPVNTLKRGFSITRTQAGRAIKSIKDVAVKDDIFTFVQDGEFKSRLKEIKEKGEI